MEIPGVLVVDERRSLKDEERPRGTEAEHEACDDAREQAVPDPPRQDHEQRRREIVEEARTEHTTAPPLRVGRIEDRRRGPGVHEREEPKLEVITAGPEERDRREREEDVWLVDEAPATRRDQ